MGSIARYLDQYVGKAPPQVGKRCSQIRVARKGEHRARIVLIRMDISQPWLGRRERKILSFPHTTNSRDR
jgi:hypothetical protein